MRKLLHLLFILVLSSSLLSCSSEEQNVEVRISSSAFLLIPASTVSCMAHKNAGSEGPIADITPSYFKIPTITFNRRNASKELVISFIRIKIPTANINCEYGGDQLAALEDTWWNNSGREASIPANTTSFSTGCALICGGISADSTFTASGTMEVFGLERDTTTLDETPVKVEAVVTVQSL